jgi:hypothetical protein
MFVRQEFDADHHGRERTPLEFTAHRVAAFPDPVEGELMPRTEMTPSALA